jgi:hypothetical protein
MAHEGEHSPSWSKRFRFALAAVCVAVLCGVALWVLWPRADVALERAERSVFSPAGEDGVLEAIFSIVHPRRRYLVDLGAGDGISGSSSRNLIVNHGWRGLLVETNADLATRLVSHYAHNAQVKTLRALIDPGDIEIRLEQNRVPKDLDLLIVGLKANDWYVWRAIEEFRPKVVQIQYNAAFVPPQTMVIEYHPFNYWDGSTYFGASIQSLRNLGKRKGYELLYANQSGTQLFFVESSRFGRFRLKDNSPLRLYRGCRTLPSIIPGTVWDAVDQEGRPLPPFEKDLVVKSVRIPRTYVFGEL